MDVNEVSSEFQFSGDRIVEFLIKTDGSNPGKLHVDTGVDYNIKKIADDKCIFVN